MNGKYSNGRTTFHAVQHTLHQLSIYSCIKQSPIKQEHTQEKYMKQSRRGVLASVTDVPEEVSDPGKRVPGTKARWPKGRTVLSPASLSAECSWLKARRWKRALVL